jgi:hypothetical protein
MWLVLSLIAFLLSLAFVLFVFVAAKVCLALLRGDVHDVFSPTRGSDNHQSPRE